MAPDVLRQSAFAQALADALAGFSDLMKMEMRLAKAEMKEIVSARIRSAVWIGISALLGIVALSVLAQFAVLTIATFGFAMHWAALTVGLVLAVGASVAFICGRTSLEGDLVPTRTLKQLTNDLRTTKESLI